MKISASILNVNPNELDDYLIKMKESGLEYLHLDIMDGVFVPNNTIKVELQKEVKKHNFIFDTHLMVDHPQEYYRDFIKEGSNYVTFHYEAVKDPNKLIDKIHSMGAKCGISIKPNTSVSVLIPYLDKIDLVLVMSVEPGFGGQKFMPSAIEKVEHLDELRSDNISFDYLIEVDGGIGLDESKDLVKAGADLVVMGTYLKKCADPKALIEEVNKLEY